MLQLNPILVKELRGRMRGVRAFVLLSVYLLILSAVTLLLYSALASRFTADLNAGQQIGRNLFQVIVAVALVEVCIITPALTSATIAGEKERQTYDLLITTLLSPWQIVWGKLAAALAFAMLLVLAIVPVMSLSFLFGGVSPTEVLIVLLTLMATAVLFASIGLFWSTLMGSTLGATSFALGSVIVLLLGIPFLVLIVSLIFPSNQQMPLPLAYLGWIVMSAHPFIALGLTDAQLLAGQGLIFWEFPPFRDPVLSSWLLYLVIALFGSIGLAAICVRLLVPVNPAVAPAEPTTRGGSPDSSTTAAQP